MSKIKPVTRACTPRPRIVSVMMLNRIINRGNRTITFLNLVTIGTWSNWMVLIAIIVSELNKAVNVILVMFV